MHKTYIDLSRTFTKVDYEAEFTVNEFYGLNNSYDLFDNSISWDSIIKNDEICIILGEAGSGKSTEFKYQADKLIKKGFYSFFIELEKLIDRSDLRSFDIEFERNFIEWNKGSSKAYFFLDSIDESKFRRRLDFRDATLNLKRLIGINNLDRCKIIMSSRHSEWHPGTDLKYIEELVWKNKAELKKVDSGSDFELMKVSYDDRLSNKKIKKVNVYKLNPLNDHQIKALAGHLLGKDSEEFIRSINIANIRSLTERPLDLRGLAYIWESKGELGSFKDILDHHIANGIRETHDRQELDPIIPERAYSGVKYLAAAVMLTKRQKFSPIDSEIIPNDNVILPRTCLPDDWSENEIRFLLQRRIFDQATFNTIKFHLRSIREFLAAQWFKDYLDQTEDYVTIRDILFKSEKNELIIRDSMKPIVAWLAIGQFPWNRRIRKDILITFPELFLKYGDPSKLPKEYLIEVLGSIREKYGYSKWIYAEENVRSLGYLGREEFVEDFRKWLTDQSISEEYKNLLFKIAIYSQLKGLSEIAKEITVNKGYLEHTRIQAISYLGEVGIKNDLDSLKGFLFSEDNLSNNIIITSVEALYPTYLNNKELYKLLKRTQDVDRDSHGIQYQLYRHIESVYNVLNVKELNSLIHYLTLLLREPPLEGFYPYSKKYYWVGDGLFSATKSLLKKKSKDIEWSLIAESIYHLSNLHKAAISYNQIILDEFEELETISELRRAYFWYSFEQLNSEDKTPHLHQIFGGLTGISNPKIEDIDWLITDSLISDRREIAQKFIQRYWNLFNRPILKNFQYKRTTRNDIEVKRIFSISIAYYFQLFYRKFKSRYGIYDWKYWFLNNKSKFKRYTDNLRGKYIIYRNIWKILNGENLNLLLHLSLQCLADNGRYSKVDLNKLEEKYSKIIVWVFVKGMKRFWITYTPNLPHFNSNRSDWETIIGLVGISLSILDDEIIFSDLSETQAQQLGHYAVNELNGFPDWISELAIAKPESIEKVFRECIDKDWMLTEKNMPIITVISKIRASEEGIYSHLNDYLYEKVTRSNPLSYSVLKEVLIILVHSSIEKDKLIELSEYNLEREFISVLQFTYLIVLLNSIDGLFATVIVQNVLIKIKKELLLWNVLLVQLKTDSALNSIEYILKYLNEDQKVNFIVGLCSILDSRSSYDYPNIEDPDYLRSDVFKKFYKIVIEYVNQKNDIIRSGSYSPEARDHAQDFRNSLLERFLDSNSKDSINTIDELLEDPSLKHLRDRIIYRREKKYQLLVDHVVWDPEDIPNFLKEHEIDPKSTYDLYKMTLNRLINIKDEIERDEHGINLNSLRNKLIAGDDETELRKFLTRELINKSKQKYSVVPEEELNPKVLPDIRIHKNSFDPIAIEIKWAQRWSGPALFENLLEQLVNQYLRAPNCDYGIYIIGYVKEKGKREQWKHPVTNKILNYQELINYLQLEANSILGNDDELKGLEVLSLNFNG